MKEPKWNKKYNFVERRFLNDGLYHNSGHIIAKIAKEEYYLGAEFKIGNCDRSIPLDIDINSEKDLDNSLHKVTQIIEVCQRFKEALEKSRPFIVEWTKYNKFKEDERKKRAKE